MQEKDVNPVILQNNNEENRDNIEPFASKHFGVENVRNYPACLDLRLSDGNSKAIPYSYILEINFNPSEGIQIITTTKNIKITGRNLKQLYHYLVAYRVKYIEANIGNDLTEEKDLFVKDIEVQEN